VSKSDDERPKGLLATLLQQHMDEHGLNPAQLAIQAGVSRVTVHRWLTGKSRSTYQEDGLLKVAAALGLHKIDANRLLRAANRPSIDALAASSDPVILELLQPWLQPIRHNLPAPLTSFVGRENEIAGLCELLPERYVRLITLTGAGGSGKTRLALRVAEEALDVFPDGVFFVSLAALTDARLVLTAVAEAIGLRNSQEATLKTRLLGWLHDRRVLLLLDNLEHLSGVDTEIVELLRAARDLTILATSRVPLQLVAEYEWPVPPLPLPEASETRGRRANRLLLENPAINLFIQRGQAVRYVLDDDDLPTIAEICTRLDGLPLAIELAAVQLRGRNPQDLLEQFPNALELAASGPHDLPQRQQTLRATIAWSVDLLPERVRALLLQLSVFAGGWTEEAARAVCSTDTADLERLTSANLVQRIERPDGRLRYSILETIREYGREQLMNQGDEPATRRRHAGYFLTLAESAPPYIPETRTTDWYDRIDADLDNIRAALEWAERQGEKKLVVRFAAALWSYWTEYQRPLEGYHWLKIALTYREQQTPAERATLLTGACTLPTLDADYQTISGYAHEALGLWQQLDDPRGQALVYRQLGGRDYIVRNGDRSISWLSKALDSWRTAGNPLGIAFALNDLILVNSALNNLAEAASYIAEAETYAENVHDEMTLVLLQRNRGFHALLSGNIPFAITSLNDALNRLRALGRSYAASGAIFYLGTALCFADQLDAATTTYFESLRIHEEVGDTLHIALTLFGLAAVAHRQQNATRAAILCGAAEAILETNRISTPPAVASIYAEEIQKVRAQLDPAAYTQAFAQGRRMSIEEAIRFARAGVTPS
jgi:predicted ATPase/transcriptional regulator with XRE-family HTH domain